MPKFLWTVVVFMAGAFAGLLIIVVKTSPDSAVNLALFFLFLFIFLTLVVSLPLYFFRFRRAPTHADLRVLYRRALKKSVFLSSLITIIGILKALNILNLPTGALLFFFYLALYKYLSAGR